VQLAVAEIVPSADKFRKLLQKFVTPDTRNAMAISVALNAPIDRPHYAAAGSSPMARLRRAAVGSIPLSALSSAFPHRAQAKRRQRNL
jgi:hypothetical protein